MRLARDARLTALVVALPCFFYPAVARADGFGHIVAIVLGGVAAFGLAVAGVVAALLFRSFAVWLFAVLACAANGLVGVLVLLQASGQQYSFVGFVSLQLALGVIACPSLIVWRFAKPASSAEAHSGQPSVRWLVLWILSHTLASMLISLLTGPLLTALFVPDPLTPSDVLLRGLLPNALLSGAAIGFIEWLLLRGHLRIGAIWIAYTALGTVAATCISNPLQSQPAAAALVGGAVLGAAQWPLLRARVPDAWHWILVSALANLVHWPMMMLVSSFTAVIIVLMPVFGALKALATGVALQRLSRRAAP